MSEILDILKKTDALITDDHFVYTSGKHGSVYINKDALYVHVNETSQVGKMLAEKASELDIDVIAGPALGGIILSQWTAHHLSEIKDKEVFSVYTEKTADGNQVFTRGYDKIVNGRKILVVEDLVTTGGSVKKVVQSVKAANGQVQMVGVMVDRSPEDDPVDEGNIGAPFFALGRLPVTIFDEASCELCRQSVPINTKIGHGKKFLESKK